MDSRLAGISATMHTNSGYNSSNSEYMRNKLQNKINSEWQYAPDIYTISEELIFGTQQYTDIDVRVSHEINSGSGTKLGDDYREFIFKDMTHVKGLGYRYTFSDNIWLTTNSDIYKFATASTTVRRCNNTIRWYDSFKILQREPCIIDYSVANRSIDYSNVINIPKADLYVIMQYNDKSSELAINDRFLFNGQAYKINAMDNFRNSKTFDDASVPLLYLYCYKDSIAEGDDLINNIPVSNINYTISLNTNTINQSIGYTSQLVSTVKRNGEVYSTPITWTSSNVSVATVDSNGNVSLIANGNCVISAKMTENNSVVANCNVTVQAVPAEVKEVRISPNVTELLQSQSQVYTVGLYVNNILTPNVFTFSGSGATSDKYVLTTINGNSFSIKNVKMSSINLIVNATNGTNSGSISIKLRGAF